MSTRYREVLRAWLAAILLGAALLPSARADFELKDAQGRRVLLKDDGTWRYLDGAGKSPASTVAAPPGKDEEQAELLLERRVEAPGGCRFEMTLVNLLPYEIRSLVPDFTVFRANDVAYNSQLTGFGPVRPGDQHRRSTQFAGIACSEIAKLQVGGGDRCEMGDLNKFSEAKGQCLARVRVLPSELLRFEKLQPAPAPAPEAASATPAKK
jgi:hypothetical protein